MPTGRILRQKLRGQTVSPIGLLTRQRTLCPQDTRTGVDVIPGDFRHLSHERRHACVRRSLAQVLAIRCALVIDHETLVLPDRAQQSRGKRQASARRVTGNLRASVAEGELTRPVTIARIVQIQCVANIASEANTVIAEGLRPVIHQLEDLLTLEQRAVATLDPKIREAAVARDIECWGAIRAVCPSVRVWNTSGKGWRPACVVLVRRIQPGNSATSLSSR